MPSFCFFWNANYMVAKPLMTATNSFKKFILNCCILTFVFDCFVLYSIWF